MWRQVGQGHHPAHAGLDAIQRAALVAGDDRLRRDWSLALTVALSALGPEAFFFPIGMLALPTAHQHEQLLGPLPLGPGVRHMATGGTGGHLAEAGLDAGQLGIVLAGAHALNLWGSMALMVALGMPPFLVELLAEHLRVTDRTTPDALVLQAPGGGPMRAGNFRSRVWAPAVATAGLDGLTFHGLRHTAAGLMIEVGAHIEAIKQRLGHSSIRVTSDVYGSLLPSVDESVTQSIQALFDESRGLPAAWAGEPREA